MQRVIAATLMTLAVLSASSNAASLVQAPAKPAVSTAAEAVVCQGKFRTYRDYNQCIRVNGARAARLCNRIICS